MEVGRTGYRCKGRGMRNRRQGVGKRKKRKVVGKELRTEDEVQCKKVGRRGDTCEGRNKERETRCRKGIMNKNALKYREDRRQVLGKE
jgi:hypothetical protein